MGKEKKEIGKLIELLNEYGRQKEGVYWIDYQADMDFTNREKTLFCSKYRGWIEWLVENDKIDRHSKDLELDMKRIRIPQNYYISGGQSLDLQHKKAKCLDLIALLAIQDEPIEFLCSLLK